MEDSTNGKRARVLVIEDNQSVRRMLRFSLRRAGFDVTEVTGGVEALCLLDKEPPEAVVLDLSLPDDLGPAIVERLEKLSHGNEYPVWVAISALDREEAIRRCGPLGNHFLPKPFDPWELVKTLETHLSGRKRS